MHWVKQHVQETISPAELLAHSLHPWISCLVVPLFALANAGVPLSRAALATAVSSPVTGGVVLGLVVGQLLALAAVAGVGFTVSLFIASLAYPTAEVQDQARVGILAGSLLAALIGAVLPRASLPPPTRP